MRPHPRRSWLATLFSLLSLSSLSPLSLAACCSPDEGSGHARGAHPAPPPHEDTRSRRVPDVPDVPATPPSTPAPRAGLLAFSREGALTLVSQAGAERASAWQTTALTGPSLDPPADVAWDPWRSRALVVTTADDESRSALASVSLDGASCELAVTSGLLRVLPAAGGVVTFERTDAGPRVRFSPHEGTAPPSRACDEPSSLVAEERDDGLFVRVASLVGEEREVHAEATAVKLGPPQRTGAARLSGPARSPIRWSTNDRTVDAVRDGELVRVLVGGEVASLDDALAIEPGPGHLDPGAQGGAPWAVALASVWRRGEPWPRAVLVVLDPEQHLQLVDLPGHAVSADVLYRRALVGRVRDGRLELFVALFEGVLRVAEREHGLLAVDRGFDGAGLVGPLALVSSPPS